MRIGSVRLTSSLIATLGLASLGATTLTGPSYAAGICSSAARCEVVAHADVDGDGAADRVALIQRPKADATVVKVQTATGKVAKEQHETDDYTATLTTYRWSAGNGWVVTNEETKTISPTRALEWYGFRVPGLDKE